PQDSLSFFPLKECAPMSLFTRFLYRGVRQFIPADRLRGRGGRPRPKSPSVKLRLEALEDRVVPIAPTVFDPNLGVQTVVSGLVTPTTMTFLGANDFFVLEKSTGKIDHVINGVVAPTQFDLTTSDVGAGLVPNLPVNTNSERGLLGIALSPN